ATSFYTATPTPKQSLGAHRPRQTEYEQLALLCSDTVARGLRHLSCRSVEEYQRKLRPLHSCRTEVPILWEWCSALLPPSGFRVSNRSQAWFGSSQSSK